MVPIPNDKDGKSVDNIRKASEESILIEIERTKMEIEDLRHLLLVSLYGFMIAISIIAILITIGGLIHSFSSSLLRMGEIEAYYTNNTTLLQSIITTNLEVIKRSISFLQIVWWVIGGIGIGALIIALIYRHLLNKRKQHYLSLIIRRAIIRQENQKQTEKKD